MHGISGGLVWEFPLDYLLDCHFEYISREFGFVDKVDPFSAVVVFIIGCTT